MAQSGTISLTVTGDYGNVTGWISWQESDVDAAANTSKVTAVLHYANAWSQDTYSSAASPAFYLTVNGSRKESAAGANVRANSTDIAVLTHTVTVSHGADGAKSITISGGGGLSGTSDLRNSAGSGTAVLTAIPRATVPVVPAGAEMGGTVTIRLPRASSDFIHRLWWRPKAWTGDWVQIGDTHGASCAWTVPDSLIDQVTGGTSTTLELDCGTYNGAALIGEEKVDVTVSVPASVKPAVSAFTVTVVNPSPIQSWPVAVRGCSKLHYELTGGGARGSSITAYEFQADGQTLRTRTGTTAALTGAGQLTAKGWVQDSRGRWSAAESRTVTVYDYTGPTVSESRVYRCSSDGAAADGGSYLNVLCRGAWSSVGGYNSAAVRLRWRRSGGTWSGYTTLTNGAETVVNAALSAEASYEAELSVTDALGGSRTVLWRIPTAAVTFHLKTGGQAAAFGKYAEGTRVLELADDWDVRYHGAAVADQVTERGVSGIWTWEKYQSGKAECWGCDTFQDTLSHGSGGLYYGDAHHADLPAGLFLTLENCQISVDGNALLWYGTGSTGGTGARTQTYYLALPTQAAAPATYYVYYHAIGRWKQ